MKGFGVFLLSMSKQQDPIGDLARDFKSAMSRTGDKSRRYKTPVAFKKYLEKHNACDEAFDALGEAATIWKSMC
jgi:hypothetical protein